MPAAHHKHKIQNRLVVCRGEETIEHWEDALVCEASAYQTSAAGTYSTIPVGDPQSYVQQASSSEMRCLQTSGWCPLQMDQQGGTSVMQVSAQVCAKQGQCVPLVKLINSTRVEGEDADYMCEQRLPYSELKLMQQINGEQGVDVKAREAIHKGVLWRCHGQCCGAVGY